MLIGSLGNAMKMAPEESEIHVLQAFYYLGMMSVDFASPPSFIAILSVSSGYKTVQTRS